MKFQLQLGLWVHQAGLDHKFVIILNKAGALGPRC